MNGENCVRYNVGVIIETEKNFLSVSGFIPAPHQTRKLFSFLTKFFCIFLTVSMFFLLLLQLLLDRHNFEKIALNLPYFITHCSFSAKLSNLMLYKSNLPQIEAILEWKFAKFSSRAEIKIFQHKLKIAKRIRFFFRVICFLSFASYCLFAAARKQELGALAKWWYFDGLNLEMVLVLEILRVEVATFLNSTMDTLVWMLISVASAEVVVLETALERIDYRLDGRDCLRKCLRRYVDVIKYSRLVESTFSMGIFGYFFGSVTCLCFTGFAIIITSMSKQKLFLLVYFFGLLVQVGMYCWYGHDLIYTSTQINDFLYNFNWYLAPKHVQVSLILLMERAKQPLSITCGKFVKLSLTTLMTILRSSYSYLAVLEHIYGTSI